ICRGILRPGRLEHRREVRVDLLTIQSQFLSIECEREPPSPEPVQDLPQRVTSRPIVLAAPEDVQQVRAGNALSGIEPEIEREREQYRGVRPDPAAPQMYFGRSDHS